MFGVAALDTALWGCLGRHTGRSARADAGVRLFLLEEEKAATRGSTFRLQTIKINAAAQGAAVGAAAIPLESVSARGVLSPGEGEEVLSRQVVDSQIDIFSLGQFEADGGLPVEGVGEIGEETRARG